MVLSIIILSVCGLVLSIYALRVSQKISKNYRPLCDISENISCTKAFSSQYGKILGVSNSTIGIVFYSLILILAFADQTKIIFYLSILAFAGTIYLSYVSYFKLKNFCLVCTAIYIINLLLLIFSYREWI